MADVVTTTKSLKIETYFVDGDTRTITLKNPKETITQNEIISLQTLLQTKQVLIGDKTGAAFGKISTVTSIEEVRTEIEV